MLQLGMNIFGGSTSLALCNQHLVILVTPPTFLLNIDSVVMKVEHFLVVSPIPK
jgi:hypothetical protein